MSDQVQEKEPKKPAEPSSPLRFVPTGWVHWTLARDLKGFQTDRLLRALLRIERTGKMPAETMSRWNGGVFVHLEALDRLIARGDLDEEEEETP